MAAQRLVHRALFLFEVAVDDGPVFPGKAVGLDLLRQLLVGRVVFGHDQQTAGVLVDAVDDPRPNHPVDPGEALPAVVQQGVDQGAVWVPWRGVDHHALGFIHHQQVPVLVDDVQGEVLGLHFQGGGIGQQHGHLLPQGELGAFGKGLPAAGHAAFGDEGLQGRPGKLRQLPGEELVQPLALLPHRQADFPAHGFSSGVFPWAWRSGGGDFCSAKNRKWSTSSTAPTVMQQSAKLKI